MTDMPPAGNILMRTGLLLMLPAMAISFGLWGYLPPSYGAEAFNQGIPAWLILVENVLRVAVFGIPLFLYFGGQDDWQRRGWYTYAAGLPLYLGSYLALIYLPESAWSMSLIGFTAPAWTTLIWFAGVGLVCAATWLPIPWHRATYLSAAAVFVGIHTAHATLSFLQQGQA